jgi:hypothetical protein
VAVRTSSRVYDLIRWFDGFPAGDNSNRSTCGLSTAVGTTDVVANREVVRYKAA